MTCYRIKTIQLNIEHKVFNDMVFEEYNLNQKNCSTQLFMKYLIRTAFKYIMYYIYVSYYLFHKIVCKHFTKTSLTSRC